MDSSAIYDTLSTIAQTLTGAFGFLLAVAMYRIQSIESAMVAAVGALIRCIQSYKPLVQSVAGSYDRDA
jgi:hypothetical protein